MAVETYSVAGDFTALTATNPDLDELGRVINADVAITTAYLGAEQTADVFDFHFVTALSAPEKTALDAIVAAHTGDAPLAQGGTKPHGAILPSAPSVTDDSSQGYTKGSIAVDDTVPEAYLLLDDTPGAAVWQRVGDATAVDFSKVIIFRSTGIIVTSRARCRMMTFR